MTHDWKACEEHRECRAVSEVVSNWERAIGERTPTYVVTGFPRSGTSMMMRCLEKGGIPVERGPRDESHLELEAKTGYLPNPHGFYERGHGTEPWWFPAGVRGAVKMELASTAVMCPGGRYRVILMYRDQEAVRKSLEAYLEALQKVSVRKPQLEKALETCRAGRYEEMMAVARAHLENRRDVEHLILAGYQDVVERPREFFLAVKEHWREIDPEAAAAVPEGKWNRNGG